MAGHPKHEPPPLPFQCGGIGDAADPEAAEHVVRILQGIPIAPEDLRSPTRGCGPKKGQAFEWTDQEGRPRPWPFDPRALRTRLDRVLTAILLAAAVSRDAALAAAAQWKKDRPRLAAIVAALRALRCHTQADDLGAAMVRWDVACRPDRKAMAAIGTNLMLQVLHALERYTLLRREDRIDKATEILQAFGWLGDKAPHAVARRLANLAQVDPGMLDNWKRRPRPSAPRRRRR